MDWFLEQFIDEAKAALISEQSGSVDMESLPKAEEGSF